MFDAKANKSATIFHFHKQNIITLNHQCLEPQQKSINLHFSAPIPNYYWITNLNQLQSMQPSHQLAMFNRKSNYNFVNVFAIEHDGDDDDDGCLTNNQTRNEFMHEIAVVPIAVASAETRLNLSSEPTTTTNQHCSQHYLQYCSRRCPGGINYRKLDKQDYANNKHHHSVSDSCLSVRLLHPIGTLPRLATKHKFSTVPLLFLFQKQVKLKISNNNASDDDEDSIALNQSESTCQIVQTKLRHKIIFQTRKAKKAKLKRHAGRTNTKHGNLFNFNVHLSLSKRRRTFVVYHNGDGGHLCLNSTNHSLPHQLSSTKATMVNTNSECSQTMNGFNQFSSLTLSSLNNLQFGKSKFFFLFLQNTIKNF